MGTVDDSRNYKPSESVYKYFLGQFIKKSREIPLDPIVYKEHISMAYAFLTRDAGMKFQSCMKDEKIEERFGHETVQVNITSILPLNGGHSYQIRWNEEKFIIGSGEKIITPYSAVFTVQMIETDDAEQLKVNPLGLYISDFNWSKDASAVNSKK